MDWCLDPQQPSAASDLRREIGNYLHRHARDPAAVPDAELAVGELLGNAVRYSEGLVWVAIDWTDLHPTLTVRDLGEDFNLDAELPDDLAEGGRGLFLVTHLTHQLDKAHRRGGGKTITASLALERPHELDIAPPRHSIGALPDLTEAGPEGFGKESFLRALVVQLSQAVEATHGPVAAQAAVAQVGADVGGQMEAAYRAAQAISGRLTPEQIADCYVRLKAAIDGDFYVIEVSDDRIVLGNRACPFGPVVQRSPALCRMTSSVFGGIAARNGQGATVTLEERIAVGDPECRVVVELRTPAPRAGPGHHYPNATADVLRADVPAQAEPPGLSPSAQ